MLKLIYDSAFGARIQYSTVPSSRFYWDYGTLDPLGIYEPTRYRYWYPHYWASHVARYLTKKHSVHRSSIKRHYSASSSRYSSLSSRSLAYL
ncbi:hypothetical protein NQ318_018627 [Aromia moschata]|uniref:Uncharacterized protein n=1 Tax=Aromia moschata TaxID=1265417 RepID=A0AAV8ZHU5_9CUCU|nr:hypothetical protein NQ318_018627 [Aromia moschata]